MSKLCSYINSILSLATHPSHSSIFLVKIEQVTLCHIKWHGVRALKESTSRASFFFPQVRRKAIVFQGIGQSLIARSFLCEPELAEIFTIKKKADTHPSHFIFHKLAFSVIIAKL